MESTFLLCLLPALLPTFEWINHMLLLFKSLRCVVWWYICIWTALCIMLCVLFLEMGKQLREEEKVARTMLKHLKKYYVKHHFLKAGTGDCE